MRARKAHTLAELILAILLIVVLTGVAVPRLQFGVKRQKEAEAAARQIVTALRRTRSLAILHAAANPDGFALRVKETKPSATYEIVDLASEDTVDSRTLKANVTLSGTTTFEYGPLGTLKQMDAPVLKVAAAGKTLTISIVPATGMVKCLEE